MTFGVNAAWRLSSSALRSRVGCRPVARFCVDVESAGRFLSEGIRRGALSVVVVCGLSGSTTRAGVRRGYRPLSTLAVLSVGRAVGVRAGAVDYELSELCRG